MASNPPFQLEDQTDEDFFDKLVDDDDDDNVDFKISASSAVAGDAFADGNESDDTKAFADLSFGEVSDNENKADNTGVDDSGGKEGLEASGDVVEQVGNEVKGPGPVPVSMPGNVEEITVSSVVRDVSGLDDTIKSDNADNASGALCDGPVINKTSGAEGSGIKEVGWGAFSADSAQEDSNAFGSYMDFFTVLGENGGESVGSEGGNLNSESKVASGNESYNSAYIGDSNNYPQEGYDYGAATGQATADQDLNSSQYWENLYPGWKYDAATGQWYQVDGVDASANTQESIGSNPAADWSTSDGKSEISYSQKTTQSVAGTVAESGTSTTESVTNWNQVSTINKASETVSNWNQVSQVSKASETVSNWNQNSQGTDSTGVALDWNQVSQGADSLDWNQVSQVNNEYPSHMVFDPQYPGWYYDTIAQEWRSLESYNASSQTAVQAQEQLNQNGFASTDTYTPNDNQKAYGAYGQVITSNSQGFNSQGQDYSRAASFPNYNQQVPSVWQPGNFVRNESAPEYTGNQQLENHHGQKFSEGNRFSQQNRKDSGATDLYYEKVNQSQNDFSAMAQPKSFVSGGNFTQHFSQSRPELIEQKHVSNEYYGNQNSASFSQQPFQAANQYTPAPTHGRSSAGRPPHTLVTFGFGGKLILMKDSSTFGNSSFGNQNSVGRTVSVLNLAEVVTEKAGASSLQPGACDYFRVLCQQSFPGPLTGGNVGTKELNKWIDERIASSESPDMDLRRSEVLRLLLSLLKIACQYYGKLRSPFGTDTLLMMENDLPESAVAKLFATAKRNDAQFSQYGDLAHCLQSLAPEERMRATAAEVQILLVSGRKKEALLCALEGQLWGPALVLAAQLGNQFYVDAVKQMALCQLVAGSPLRTLCLLIAGQPADVFSMDTTAGSSMPGAISNPQQSAQLGANSMLDYWEENLAVITSNRTKDDELVLIHLGDSLWKERSDIIAAHICYLVAEANFEPYSDSARMCLLGGNHWKFPRTYASPEAIQRTEIYEYSKVLGNSQFILLPFQPYKLVYAHMLAEVGRMSDALKYCQAVLKSLKTGRAPEVETLRQLVSSLEERIKSHQQGGFSTNLAPAKLVGKLLNLFDSTAHRVVGSLPPPAPSTSGTSVHGIERSHQSMSTSQSTMAMSSLMPSASMEPVSELAAGGNRMTMHNRSISEPDFGRSPRQVDSTKGAGSASGQGKAARFGGFGFGSQLLQKTVGLVLRPRQDRQAKLGDTNKFYYDEKLKRWVEEGAAPPAEEAALAPPPTTATFQNGTSDYNLKTALNNESSVSNGSPQYSSPPSVEHSSGIPPLPPTSNQFSAHGRMGVRARYVDTFNQGGGNRTNLFQSPPVPSIKPAGSGGVNPKFFVPSPVAAAEQPVENTFDRVIGSSATNENPLVSSNISDSIQPPATTTMLPRGASMDNISHMGAAFGNSSFSSQSRRTASWSGSFNGGLPPTQRSELRPLGEVLGMPPSSFMPTDPSTMHSSMNGGSLGDLQEVDF